jgi:hypothetical protein
MARAGRIILQHTAQIYTLALLLEALQASAATTNNLFLQGSTLHVDVNLIPSCWR